MRELDKIYGDGFISPIEIDDEKTDTHRPSDDDKTPDISDDDIDYDVNENGDDTGSEEDEEEEDHIEDYGKSDYWDDRYLNDTDQFDWLVEYKDLEKEDLIYNIIYPTDFILILGCGNATFSEEMYNHNFHNITNIDLSQVVLDQMKEKNKDKPKMKYLQMDVTNLLFPDESFNVVIDKSTMDCLLCCVDSDDKIHSMLKESFRCLKPYGMYYCITLHEKEKMLEYFEKPDLPWRNIFACPIPNPRWEPGSDRHPYHHIILGQK